LHPELLDQKRQNTSLSESLARHLKHTTDSAWLWDEAVRLLGAKDPRAAVPPQSIVRNEEEAYRCLCRAAELGHPGARFCTLKRRRLRRFCSFGSILTNFNLARLLFADFMPGPQVDPNFAARFTSKEQGLDNLALTLGLPSCIGCYGVGTRAHLIGSLVPRGRNPLSKTGCVFCETARQLWSSFEGRPPLPTPKRRSVLLSMEILWMCRLWALQSLHPPGLAARSLQSARRSTPRV
jgi:hypothetical protein